MRMAPNFWLVYGRDIDVAGLSTLRLKRDNIVLVQKQENISDPITALIVSD